ncbi:MAG TPA: PEP-CTERM sorting domain-containing protein [Pirellulales bacterium]|nr:PEP-CTERM sorting domain-containing protein [Pirellulales bacterium]
MATSTIPTPPIAYWTGNVNANWNTVNQAANATNWATDATGAADADYFPGSPTDVFFTTSSHGANLGTTLAADFSIKGLTFTSDATSAVTIGGTNKLTLGVDGITVQSGAAAPVINAPVTLGSAQNWTIDGANSLIVNGSLSTAGFALTKMGTGTLTLGGVPNLALNTTLNVGAGTLILQVTGPPTIGSGVTVSVSSGATLQLAGSVSALSNGTARVNVTNSSTAAGTGIVVSGTHQQVGNIDGTGTTTVNAESDLTANHIVQSALIIGGASGSPAQVTIAASDASGNPLGQSSGLALAGSLTPSDPFTSGSPNSPNLLASGGSSASGSTTGGGNLSGDNLGNSAAVPEPTTLVPALLGLAALGCIGRRKRK